MTAAPPLQIVTFRLGEDRFAADVFAVERVLRWQAPRAVPDVPAWIVGVIDVQDRVVPVVDLRRRFELPPAPPRPETRLLVLDVDGEWVAAVVDAVESVAPLDPSAVQPPPALFRGLAGRYLRGLVQRGEALVLILDVDPLFSTSERLVLEQVRGAGAADA
jgi:purine-binding chemotaxis protein CheW